MSPRRHRTRGMPSLCSPEEDPGSTFRCPKLPDRSCFRHPHTDAPKSCRLRRQAASTERSGRTAKTWRALSVDAGDSRPRHFELNAEPVVHPGSCGAAQIGHEGAHPPAHPDDVIGQDDLRWKRRHDSSRRADLVCKPGYLILCRRRRCCRRGSGDHVVRRRRQAARNRHRAHMEERNAVLAAWPLHLDPRSEIALDLNHSANRRLAYDRAGDRRKLVNIRRCGSSR